MLVKDTTKQQANKICDYMYEKYGEIDENNIPNADQDDICKHCPFSTSSVAWTEGDDTLLYHCAKNILYNKIEDELLNYLSIKEGARHV